MHNNVINFLRFKTKISKTPNDLVSFKEFALKHDMKQGTLYKLAERGSILRYKRGIWKISESEVLRYLDGDKNYG